ncbi:MAG: hypothetical protein V4696_03720 [Pseudomonadota bacterium]
MRVNRFFVFAALSTAIASAGAALERMGQRISEAIWSAVAFAIRTVAYAPRFSLAGEGFGGHMVPRSYVSPPDTLLRHEARVKKRAADRHI